MTTLTKVLTSACAILAFWLWWVMGSYGDLKGDYSTLKDKFSEQVAITADYEKRITSLHELDTKHTTELTNAKAEIDKLRDDVRSGRKRVYINAECPNAENSSTSSVDASGSPSLARDAEQDYFDLLKQLETLEKQYLGLRDYYYAECIR
ncbi:lysis protein [Providencia vermicola]|uniref:lysis protein n=1 Tax=Providencia vermicola TaxID=333965 RepID=UPI0013A7131F|nr:lysis protein [Providencia vermicola]QIC15381.1 lysis protein [Providencia vermicola]